MVMILPLIGGSCFETDLSLFLFLFLFLLVLGGGFFLFFLFSFFFPFFSFFSFFRLRLERQIFVGAAT